MTYNMFTGTLNPTQSINQSISFQPVNNLVSEIHALVKKIMTL